MEGIRNEVGGQHLLGFLTLQLFPARELIGQCSYRKKPKLQSRMSPRSWQNIYDISSYFGAYTLKKHKALQEEIHLVVVRRQSKMFSNLCREKYLFSKEQNHETL